MPPRTLRIAAVPALALSLAACGKDAEAGGFAARDSAGVRIAESTAPAWKAGEGWTVAAEPSVDLGGEEAGEEQQFGRVTDALRLSDGTIVVADGQASELRWFAPGGALRARAGRQGGGPGEFANIRRIVRLPGDSVGAWDLESARLTTFDRAGALGPAYTLRPGSGTLSDLVGVMADGSPVVYPVSLVGQATSERPLRDTVAFLRSSRDGAKVDTLARLPGEETVTITTGDGPQVTVMRGMVPWGGATYPAVRGDATYLAESGRGDVEVRGPDGTLRAILRGPRAAQPVTGADRQAFRARQMPNRPNMPAEVRAMMQRMVDRIPFPETKSAFAGMVVDSEGAVWLQAHTDPDSAAAYDVFAPEGRLLGRVTMPKGLRVREIGRDYVLGTWADELEVQHVRLHALTRS